MARSVKGLVSPRVELYRTAGPSCCDGNNAMALRSLVRVSLAIAFLSPVWAAKQPITQTDLLKIERVTEVRVTPDGAFAVYGVQSIHTDPPATPGGDPAYKYRVNLWMSDLRDPNAKPVQITFGDRNDSMLAISPDGRQLAFVRADEKKHPQVWVMPLHTPGEPRMLTTLEHGATAPRWRADGKALLVSSAIPISKIARQAYLRIGAPRARVVGFRSPSY